MQKQNKNKIKPYTKQNIPAALRQATWIHYNGINTFLAKCQVTWCENTISPFDFQVGHNIPESKGGTLDLSNLRPICASCNRSMGNSYTIDEFSALSTARAKPEIQPLALHEVVIKQRGSWFTRCLC